MDNSESGSRGPSVGLLTIAGSMPMSSGTVVPDPSTAVWRPAGKPATVAGWAPTEAAKT